MPIYNLINQFMYNCDVLQFLQIRKVPESGWEHTRQLIVLKMTMEQVDMDQPSKPSTTYMNCIAIDILIIRIPFVFAFEISLFGSSISQYTVTKNLKRTFYTKHIMIHEVETYDIFLEQSLRYLQWIC